MKILIASDSYKGSLSSLEVSKSIQKGFKEVFEDVSFKTLSMADGGEGTTQAIVESLNGQYITIDCHNYKSLFKQAMVSLVKELLLKWQVLLDCLLLKKRKLEKQILLVQGN